jgi:hypothetical protein
MRRLGHTDDRVRATGPTSPNKPHTGISNAGVDAGPRAAARSREHGATSSDHLFRILSDETIAAFGYWINIRTFKFY